MDHRCSHLLVIVVHQRSRGCGFDVFFVVEILLFDDHEIRGVPYSRSDLPRAVTLAVLGISDILGNILHTTESSLHDIQ